MHVLFLPSWYPMHYAPTRGIFFREQAQALRDQGVKVGVVYPNFRGLRTFRLDSTVLRDHFQTTVRVEEGIPEYRFHGWNPKIKRLRKEAFLHQSRRLMRRYVDDHGMPDLIHAHSAIWGGVAAQDLAQHVGLPYAVTEHSSAFLRGKVDEWQKSCARECFEQADVVWAVSNAFRERLRPFVGEADVRVMPNMVSPRFFHRPSQPRTSDPFTFLSVGSLTANKGIDVLLRAFAHAVQSGVDAHLQIGGDGPESNRLRDLAVDLEVENRVQFLGMLSREEVRYAMWRANAFVSSSYVETFGIVLIEAMATGLPVVATRSGGPCDIVHSDVGHLAPTGDAQALAKAMTRVKQMDRDETEIRRYVKDKYSTKVVASRLKSWYQDLARDNRG